MTLLSKVRTRLGLASVPAHLRGALLRRKFTRAGIVVVQPGRPGVRVTNHGGEIICENCSFFPGVRLEVFRGGRIFIGSGTYLNRNTEVIAETEVHIGRQCKISWDVVIMDTDQHGFGSAYAATRPVFIGDNVWIGCRAIILKGVKIGAGAVIGAGAIVTHDVPSGAIVTGQAAAVRSYVGQTTREDAYAPTSVPFPTHNASKG